MRALAVSAALFGLLARAEPPPLPPPDRIPSEGAIVGRNAKLWTFDSGSGLQLYDSSGQPVPGMATRITIPPFQSFEKLTPTMELQPGRYEVRRFSEERVSTFEVRDESTW